jgi:hypothetical protein
MLAEGLLAIARGEGLNGKPVREADRIRAFELLLAYGWGKPAAFMPIEGGNPLEHDEVADAIQAIANELRVTRADAHS